MEIVTEGEKKMIQMIAESDFRDDTDDLGGWVWSPATKSEEKGWLSSCVKKGFAIVDNQNPKEAVAMLTAEGIKIYEQNFK